MVRGAAAHYVVPLPLRSGARQHSTISGMASLSAESSFLARFTLAHATWSVSDTAADELLCPLAIIESGAVACSGLLQAPFSCSMAE